MNKNNCKIGQEIAHFPPDAPTSPEFGIVTELREKWAMVKFEGSEISKAVYYSDIESVPESITSIGKI